MTVELHKPSRTDRGLIRRMMELYLHDLSEFDGEDLDEHAVFGYGDLDYFWFEETHAAFVLRVDGKLAGFVLIDSEVVLQDSQRSLTEFFVLRKYRRKCVGRQAAEAVLGLLPAKWEVRVMAANLPAQAFWRGVIEEHTQGRFTEVQMQNEDWKGPIFSFDNRS